MTRTPHTYDEITRRTVPDPDTSFRPPLPHECERTDADLLHEISVLLDDAGLRHIGFEVHNGRVVLRGQVRDRATAMMVEHVIAALECVEDVESLLEPLHP